MKKFHANLSSQANSLNTSFFNTVIWSQRKTLQNNSSASNSSGNFGQKSQSRAQVTPFCQQPWASSQPARIWPRCILGKTAFLWAGKTYLQPISYFFYKSLTRLQSCTKSFPVASIIDWNFHIYQMKPGETRFICFMAPCPWTTNCQQLQYLEHLVAVRQTHSANKQFFGIGKV